jgi:hypothetical protein
MRRKNEIKRDRDLGEEKREQKMKLSNLNMWMVKYQKIYIHKKNNKRFKHFKLK